MITFGNISDERWEKAFGKKTPEQQKLEREEFVRKQAEKSLEEAPRSKARWPIASAALAENDVDAARERCKKHGVSTDFNSEGCPIFTSENHRREYTRMIRKETGIRFIDKQAWY